MNIELNFDKDSFEVKKLAMSDENMSNIIEVIDKCDLYLRTNFFSSLVRIIVGQQLSIKATVTIWKRLQEICGEINPTNINDIDNEKLRLAGLSLQKSRYIKELARNILENNIDFDSINLKKDEEIIEALINVKGIGIWTAEMFLIFSLGRLDVFSKQDVGLRRAIKWLYNMDELPSSMEMITISEKWKPYRTIASLYLWEIINRDFITNYQNFSHYLETLGRKS